MSAIRDKRGTTNDKGEDLSYTLLPPRENLNIYCSPKDDERLGEIRKAEVFETEHHVYTAPFRYKNVTVNGWTEYGPKGVELVADVGSITIEEEQPIISLTIVGSGCSGSNYNVVEWWGPGEKLSTVNRGKTPQLIKRQRIDNLKGQHNAWIQSALTQEPPEFKSLHEAKRFLQKLQRNAYNMTSGFYMPGSLMAGLYENTAFFRIGDTSRPELNAFRIVVRGGGLDYEDPGLMYTPQRSRYPADYAFRLIDLAVKKTSKHETDRE